jgi:hypothetical protein
MKNSGLIPIPSRSALSRAGIEQLPAVIVRAGGEAAQRFLEFLAGSIRNPHTRRAYGRAALTFFEWCERRHLRELSALEPSCRGVYRAARPGGDEAQRQAGARGSAHAL